MEQRISLTTLGVADVERSFAFYRQLGWQGQQVDDTVFFQADGQALVLWSRALLAADCGVEDDGEARFGGVVLAHNVRTSDEVDDVLAAAAVAGAAITKPAASTFYGGYAGCFRDPDGHLWEIAHNPGFTIDDTGALILPDFGVPD